MTKPLILIWSKDADFYLLLSYILLTEGFETAIASDEDIVAQTSGRPVRVVVLDGGRNSANAAALCTTLKSNEATSRIPTVALVSSGEDRHYIELLRAGIDESFVRPVSPAHLIAYLRSILPADQPSADVDRGSRSLSFGDLEMLAERRTIVHNGSRIELSPIEFRLLRHLFDSPGRVFSRTELIEAAWPPNLIVQPRTVDVHMGRLRRSLQKLTGRALIRTVRAAGYAVEF